MKTTMLMTALAAVALTATQATAWESWGTRDGDARMDCSVNTGYASSEYSAMQRGGRSWNRVSCSNFNFRKDVPLKINRSVPVRDGYNHIIYGNTSGALAVTWLMNNSSNRECDMIIEQTINWNNGPDPTNYNEYDLESVVCHEFGHFLGLGHSATQAATMYYALGNGDDSKRTLHSDDEAGVCYLY